MQELGPGTRDGRRVVPYSPTNIEYEGSDEESEESARNRRRHLRLALWVLWRWCFRVNVSRKRAAAEARMVGALLRTVARLTTWQDGHGTRYAHTTFVAHRKAISRASADARLIQGPTPISHTP